MKERLERYFGFKEFNTSFSIEMLAGLTTFLSACFILAANPNLLGAAGMDERAVFTATALASCIGTLIMALFTNYPFILTPGIGMSTFFAYTVVNEMGLSYQEALAAVFIEGILFLLLSLTKFPEWIFSQIPYFLRCAITGGVGLYLAAVGFNNSNILLVDNSSILTIYRFSDLSSQSLTLSVALACIGFLISACLFAKGKRWGILVGIVVTWVLGAFLQSFGLYVPDGTIRLPDLIPQMQDSLRIPSILPVLLQFDFSKVLTATFIMTVFSFLALDVFDSVGALIGCTLRAGYIKRDEVVPKCRRIFQVDAIATIIGASLGASTTTTGSVSAIGIAEGGRTGFTGVTAAFLFLVALFLAPFFIAIPPFATGPALVIIGYYFIQQLKGINFYKPSEGIPAFVTIVSMPLLFSITDGMGLGFITYAIIERFCSKKKKVRPAVWIIALLFLVKFIFF